MFSVSLARVAAATVTVFGAGGIVAAATAAISSGDEIHACVESSDGRLRIVDDAAQCSSNESPIAWNQTGPEGPTGPQGPAGPPLAQILDVRGFDDLVVREPISWTANGYPNHERDPYPLRRSRWTQSATETDAFYGQIRFQAEPNPAAPERSATCTTWSYNRGEIAHLLMTVRLNTRKIAEVRYPPPPPPPPGSDSSLWQHTRDFALPHSFEPGSDTDRELKVEFQSTCPNDVRFIVHYVKINVMRYQRPA